MKQFLTFLLLLCSYLLCEAQAITLTVNNKIAGTLSQRILYDDKLTVENLIISGEINADDMTYIDELNSKYSLKGTIDMSDANIVSGGRHLAGNDYLSTTQNTLNIRIFSMPQRIKKFVVPKTITNWYDATYYQGGGTYHSYINADSLIIDCPNLKSISNGIGNPSYLYVGEGVQSLSIASYYLNQLPGASDNAYMSAADSMYIHLPETLLSLRGNKRMGSPRMSIFSKIKRPDLLSTDSNKWEETVLNNGIIYAPNDTRIFYESSIFKNLEIVAPVSVSGIGLNKSDARIIAGESLKLEAKIIPSNADNQNIIWYSSDNKIATVDENGLVVAKKGGNAQIVANAAENPNIKATCHITVIQPAAGITLNTNNMVLIEEEFCQLMATVIPEDASNKDINWTSSDISIAMVSQDGTVYAIKPGQATIMATTVDGGFVALCKVIVKAKEITATAIRLSHNSETITIGEKFQLNAVLEPENVTNKTISWTSTNPNIATVNADGIVQALAEGTTQIIATTTDGSNLSAICNITIEKQLISITNIQISPSTARIAVGKSVQLNAILTPVDATSTNVLWSSTNSSVATVSQDGEVTAIAVGDAIIIASTQDGSNLSATCNISVYNEVIPVSEIILTPAIIEGLQNESATINAVVIPENATNKQLKWSSSNDDVALVSNGIVNFIKKGTAIITAEAIDGSNVKSECEVIVSDSAGIESIIKDRDTYVKIYDLNGYLVYQGIYCDARINSGIYIVLYNGKSFKTKIN